VAQWNAGLLVGNGTSLVEVMRHSKATIYILQEFNTNHYIAPKGYTTYKDNKTLMIVADIHQHTRNERSIDNEFISATFVDVLIKGHTETITFASIYRKHARQHIGQKQFLETWLKKTLRSLENTNFLIGGDWNAMDKSWSPTNSEIGPNLKPCGKVIRQQVDLHPHTEILNTKSFTHWPWNSSTVKQNPSSLDITIGDKFETYQYKNWTVGEQFGSDHAMITIDVQLMKSKKQSCNIPCISKPILSNRTEQFQKELIKNIPSMETNVDDDSKNLEKIILNALKTIGALEYKTEEKIWEQKTKLL
jgi:hypothetical protein